MDDEVVCGDYWDSDAATVLCRELRLGAPKEYFTYLRYGKPLRNYMDMRPVCNGSEASLDLCQKVSTKLPCTVPAGVVCRRVTMESKVT